MSVTLTQGNFCNRVWIQRDWDIELFLIPPVYQLYDIELKLEFPFVKDNDILISLVREAEFTFNEFKKTDVTTGFVTSAQSTISNRYSDAVIIDSNLTNIVNISSLIGVPRGTFDSMKSVSENNIFSGLPISDKFFIVEANDNIDKSRVHIPFFKGWCLLYFKHSKSSHPSSHDKLLEFFDIDRLQYITYLTSPNQLPTNIDEYYSTYWITYLFASRKVNLYFGINSDDASEIEVDGEVVVSWYGGHGFDSSLHSSQNITLTPGWHRIIIRHEEITGGDGIRAYFRPSGVSDWLEFNNYNISQQIPGSMLFIPIYYNKEEAIEKYFTSPLDEPEETSILYITTSDITLFKSTDYNKNSLSDSIKKLSYYKVDYNIALNQGNLVSGSFDDVIVIDNNSGVILDKDDSGNNPIVEISFNEQTKEPYIEFYISTGIIDGSYQLVYKPSDDFSIVIKAYSDDGDESILNGAFIDPFECENVKNVTTYSDYTIIKVNSLDNPVKIKFKKDTYIKRLTIEFQQTPVKVLRYILTYIKQDNFTVIGKNSQHFKKLSTAEGIKFDDITLKSVRSFNISKEVYQVADIIMLNTGAKYYLLKILNLPYIYTISVQE